MPNLQVTHSASPNNARSESNIAINPNNPQQIVSSSKKFIDPATYNFTLATEYSPDGGQSWHDSAALATPGFTMMTDPTLAWDDIGNVYLVGLGGNHVVGPPVYQTTGIVVYKSVDGGKTWSSPYPIPGTAAGPGTSTTAGPGGADKQWVAGDSSPSSPYHGRAYAVWDNTTTGGMAFMRTTDNGASWIGPGPGATTATAGASITSGTAYPEIHVSADGTIFIVSVGSDASDNPAILMLVSTDGGDTFQASAVAPASGITTLSQVLSTTDSGFPVFPGGNFRVLTDPTITAVGPMVYVAWADAREGFSRIYYAQSIDGGTTWTTPASGAPLLSGSFPSGYQHFHPQLAVDPSGVVGCAFYEFGPKPSTYLIDVIMSQSFDHGATWNYFVVTDQPWNPAIDAPNAESYADTTFIGDYFGLDASSLGFFPLWTDTRTGIQELFTTTFPEKGCEFIIEQSTIGEDELGALRVPSPHDALFTDLFRVVVDGFTASQLGISSTAGTLDVASPFSGATVTCTGNTPSSGGYGPGPQRFTFHYNMDFGPAPAAGHSNPGFGFTGPTKLYTLNVSVNPQVSASAQIELIKQPDPYMLHGDPAWLSVDLRVFPMRTGDTKFGQMMGDASTANNFIQQIAHALSVGGGTAGGQSFDDSTVLPSDEEASALYLTPEDEHSHPVFDFVLARVRYRGLIGATKVRVFFRLFAAQATTGIFDNPPGEQYRRATNTHGDPVPLAGIILDEYVTIPCFALPRVPTSSPMSHQTDTRTVAGKVLGNIQTITAHADGSEVDTFFGAWIDVNQTSTNVLPATPGTSPDGPFTDPSNPPLPLAQAIARNMHQCIVAEIAFDPTPIPVGKDPSNWDKLAQRNIAWSGVGSASAVTTFEIRPTAVGLPAGIPSDELMIDWGSTPPGSVASIYLPSASAGEIISMASRSYMGHRLTQVDEHTVSTPVGGITYLPIPAGSGSNLAGLLSVEVPSGTRRGQVHTVVVRQVTSTVGETVNDKKQRGEFEWRRVVGAFQLMIPVGPKSTLLVSAERELSLLRWMAEAIRPKTRWYPVFERYLEVMAGRVTSFGGDPTHIGPSPTGNGKGPHPHHHHHHRRHPDQDVDITIGKVESLVFDHFGDFLGFVLEDDHGHRHRFDSREQRMRELSEHAFHQRWRLTVAHDGAVILEIWMHGDCDE